MTSYETNGNKVIVKNILSVTKPSYFEIETYLKLSMMLNKKNYDEKKIKKEVILYQKNIFLMISGRMIILKISILFGIQEIILVFKILQN